MNSGRTLAGIGPAVVDGAGVPERRHVFPVGEQGGVGVGGEVGENGRYKIRPLTVIPQRNVGQVAVNLRQRTEDEGHEKD
jgi:hypothetical protein